MQPLLDFVFEELYSSQRVNEQECRSRTYSFFRQNLIDFVINFVNFLFEFVLFEISTTGKHLQKGRMGMEHRISHDDVLSLCLILVQVDVIRQNYATEDLTFDAVVLE